MNDAIGKIRELLDELEARGGAAEPSFKDSFQLFELPELVANIVDYLQPALAPREAAIYWYLFRHSILSTGDVFARLSTTALQEKAMACAAAAGRSQLSATEVGEALIGLVTKGVIAIAGEADSRGTPYRIRLPEEIAICREAMVRHRQNFPELESQRELDFYQIREHRLRIFERDGYACYVCKKPLTRFSATLDHRRPLSQGGDNGFSNLVTCCWQHNSHRRLQASLPALPAESGSAPPAEPVPRLEATAPPVKPGLGATAEKPAAPPPETAASLRPAKAPKSKRTSAGASRRKLPERSRRKRPLFRPAQAPAALTPRPPPAPSPPPVVPSRELKSPILPPPSAASVPRRAWNGLKSWLRPAKAKVAADVPAPFAPQKNGH
jgi:hypothetical protein